MACKSLQEPKIDTELAYTYVKTNKLHDNASLAMIEQSTDAWEHNQHRISLCLCTEVPPFIFLTPDFFPLLFCLVITDLTSLQPFTNYFPCVDIHKLLSPDLLHQVIKGTFKDHLVTWIESYLHLKHGRAHSSKIRDDIDRWYATFTLRVLYNGQFFSPELLQLLLLLVYTDFLKDEDLSSGLVMTPKH
jgi:hypothetical protein